MDRKFQMFEDWYKTNINRWEQVGVLVDKTYQSIYAHQYHIEVYAVRVFALGRISLYESNGLYWVDFEAVHEKKDNFFRVNINYSHPTDIEKAMLEFIEYLSC